MNGVNGETVTKDVARSNKRWKCRSTFKPPLPTPTALVDLKTRRPVLMAGFLGGTLNLTAGYMNAVCFVVWGNTATHSTGLATKAATALVEQHVQRFTRYALGLVLFTAGACVSTLMIGGRKKFQGGKHYSPVLALIGFVVLGAALIGRVASDGKDEQVSVLVCSLVSLAAGAQNAMTTYFSGAIIRTTHVTGTLTDIGIEVASLMLRKRWGDTWKLEILVCFFFGFFLGGVLGTAAALQFSDLALFLPGGLYIAMSIGNFLYHHTSVSVAPGADMPQTQSATTIRTSNYAGDHMSVPVAPGADTPPVQQSAITIRTGNYVGDLEGGRLCDL
mmetsp:Transcript_55285/g.110990  ORF Transcript_55285/g.110990 Transcript_55285/m.110990 type:complete len:332 (-) Transcript_55285:226-1221(-)